MPNWVTNRIRVKGPQESLEMVLKQHVVTIEREDRDGSKYKDTFFDFNTIIPEPKIPEDCEDEYRLDVNPDASIGVDGSTRPWFNWYAWRCAKWGTKWNAHDTQVCGDPKDGEIEIWFDTAWSPVLGIYERFAIMHPNLEIEATYVEEQGPVYTGMFAFKGGDCKKAEEPPEESKRAHEIMFEMWGNEDAYVYDPETDNYKLIDGDDEPDDETNDQ